MNKDKLQMDFSSKDWVRCQSKSHTGRFYMFNKATGETKWCSLDADAVAGRSEESNKKSSNKIHSPPKMITSKLIKTPAQDRLKRLQSNLHKDLKDLKDKNSKKERIKNNQNINSPTRKDTSNKIKEAFMTEKMILPYKGTVTASPSKATLTAACSRATLTASRSKAIVTASPSRATATASPSRPIVTETSSNKSATVSHSRPTATATSSKKSLTVTKDSVFEDTLSAEEGTPRLNYNRRRLRRCSAESSLVKTSIPKQNHDKTSAANQSPNKSSSAKKSPKKTVAEKSNDKKIVDQFSPPKSSRLELDKRSPHLKRHSTRKSPKKSSKKRRHTLPLKCVRFPDKGVNYSFGNSATDDGCSSDDAANTSSDTSASPALRVSLMDKIKAICKSTFGMRSLPNTMMKFPLTEAKNPINLGLTTSFASIQTAYKAFRDYSDRERNMKEHEAETASLPSSSNKLMLLPAVRLPDIPQILPPPPPLPSPPTPPPSSPPPSSPLPIVECNTPNNQVVPAYPRGSANSRLRRLRESLFLQPSSSAKNYITDASSSCSNTKDFGEEYNKNCYSNNNDLSSAAEPMDWQSMDDYSRRNSLEIVNFENTKNTEINYDHSSANKDDGGTVSEYYDSVNANLLRFAAEQQDRIKWSGQKWLTDHYYFVIDTNVLLQNITFIDDLIEMKLCDTNGTIIYIPYCVLQELDKLKMRSSSESAKTLTVRAIKYLNKKFEEHNKHIHAQSAIDERDHLIDVLCADDSILNCCLHVKRHVENIVLLTEDVNLRNKAICNNILVTTKSDLISKHAEPSTLALFWQEDARK